MDPRAGHQPGDWPDCVLDLIRQLSSSRRISEIQGEGARGSAFPLQLPRAVPVLAVGERDCLAVGVEKPDDLPADALAATRDEDDVLAQGCFSSRARTTATAMRRLSTIGR